MNYIDKYIILDEKSIPIYKTFDLVDLAFKLISLNNEIIHRNHNLDYMHQKYFNYKIIIEKYKINS